MFWDSKQGKERISFKFILNLLYVISIGKLYYPYNKGVMDSQDVKQDHWKRLV